MALQADIADLDAWIEKLKDCKQLEENEVKELCRKVRSEPGTRHSGTRRGRRQGPGKMGHPPGAAR